MLLVNLLLWYQAKICSIIELFNGKSHMLKRIIFFLFLFLNVATISFFISAFIYGTVYFYHRPKIYHSVPLNFNYQRGCIQDHKLYEMGKKYERNPYKGNCFPVAVVPLKNKHYTMLEEDLRYTVTINLELPETPANLEMGMFMISMDVHGNDSLDEGNDSYWSTLKQKHHGKQSVSRSMSSSTSTSMKYRSPLVRLVRFFMMWPLFIMDIQQESQIVDTLLFDNLYLDRLNLNWTAKIVIDNPAVQLYSARLDISAKFNGLQHFFYNWPLMSFLLGTCSIFIPVLLCVGITVYLIVWKAFNGRLLTSGGSDDVGDITMADFCHERLDEVEVRNRNVLQQTTADRQVGGDDDIDLDDSLQRNDLIISRSRSSSASSSSIEMISTTHIVTSSSNGTISKSCDDKLSSPSTLQLSDHEEMEVRKRIVT